MNQVPTEKLSTYVLSSALQGSLGIMGIVGVMGVPGEKVRSVFCH